MPGRRSVCPKRDYAAAEKLGFRLSLQCWTFRELTFFETVDKAAGLGVKYLEAYPGQRLKPGSSLVFDSNMSDDVARRSSGKWPRPAG